jgi:LacI family transcriptional regulator
MKVDIKEIARKAGVSIATVSRTLNGKGPVREETRQKILQIAREYNYKPNPIARGLSRRQTDTIGVILPDLMDEFFMDLIHSIDEETYRTNRFVLISSSHSQRNMVETLIEFMGSGRVDGVILMAPEMDKSLVELLKKSKRPIVLLNASKLINTVPSFNINNHQGAMAIVEHLIGHGFRDIAMIKGPQGNCDADERFNGYIDALAKHGIPFRDELIVAGNFTIRAGYYGFMRLMSLSKKPDAIFAANDMMALGVYEAARNSNIKIPQDVAVTGFDDIFLTRLINPRLTTVHVPIAELGSKAVRHLLKMISGEVNSGQNFREELSVGMVIGGSCGCANAPSQLLI